MATDDAERHEDAAPVKVGTRFRCAGCGAEVVVVKAPAGPVRCCDRPMERL
jgi:hypothetical protein